MGNDLINMVDPTGEFLQTIVCGFVGGNVGLTFDYISKGGNMSGQEMLVSFFGGGMKGSGLAFCTIFSVQPRRRKTSCHNVDDKFFVN